MKKKILSLFLTSFSSLPPFRPRHRFPSPTGVALPYFYGTNLSPKWISVPCIHFGISSCECSEFDLLKIIPNAGAVNLCCCGKKLCTSKEERVLPGHLHPVRWKKKNAIIITTLPPYYSRKTRVFLLLSECFILNQWNA